MSDIHPSAVIHPTATLGAGVKVGPFCYIGANVTLGDACVLHSHVVLDGPSTFGKGNEFFPFCQLGLKSQDLKYRAEPTYLQVGDYNVFREKVSINRATDEGDKTIIGNHNLFIVSCHLGHDCVVGDHVIVSGGVLVAGHVTLGDFCILSGSCAIHQHVRIGEHCIVGAMARMSKDAPPYTIVEGFNPEVRGINTVGLQRRGFAEEDIRALKNMYKRLYLKKDLTIDASIEQLMADDSCNKNQYVLNVIEFVKSSPRGAVR